MPDSLTALEGALAGRRVLLTGHTGFTGGWLALWLRALGCEVTGLALPPDTEPNFFTSAGIGAQLKSRLGDIRDIAVVQDAMAASQASLVFHLAAQPLVSRGFAEPLATFATNVMGTAHVLEAASLQDTVKAVVCVTTDKVYADIGRDQAHHEGNQLGGRDPYAASKAAAELVAGCYRDTMVARANNALIATARGGNIIGGGDWSRDRIVPDFVRAVIACGPLLLRNPDAVRPWQHVLALVHGYLALAARLIAGDTSCARAWNFGPHEHEAASVQQLVDALGQAWRRPVVERVQGAFPETHVLRLDSAAARARLGWRPALAFADAVAWTAEWYRDFYAQPESASDLALSQINQYRQRCCHSC